MVTQHLVTVGHVNQEAGLGTHSALASIPWPVSLPTWTSKKSSLTFLTLTDGATLTLGTLTLGTLTLGTLTIVTPVTSRRATIHVLDGYGQDKEGQCDDQSLHLKWSKVM